MAEFSGMEHTAFPNWFPQNSHITEVCTIPAGAGFSGPCCASALLLEVDSIYTSTTTLLSHSQAALVRGIGNCHTSVSRHLTQSSPIAGDEAIHLLPLHSHVRIASTWLTIPITEVPKDESSCRTGRTWVKGWGNGCMHYLLASKRKPQDVLLRNSNTQNSSTFVHEKSLQNTETHHLCKQMFLDTPLMQANVFRQVLKQAPYFKIIHAHITMHYIKSCTHKNSIAMLLQSLY